MPDPAGTKIRLIRFGSFELDARAGELRKHGIRIKLREQPVRILLMLLEQPGEVVLREEIQRRLWPNNTIVEFDHGINAAIQKLRDALGESADKPRYIETVARRGYRFLGEVEKVGEPQPEPVKLPPPAENGNLNGRTVSHYRILGKMGEGGMGVVYRAEDLKLGRIVAIKCLPCPAGELPQTILRRFETEARAASALNHPHICTIYGFEELDGQPAIVMELVEGETLAARLQRGPLKQDRAVAWALQIADAMAEAHSKGVVHRDLKPANIMIGKSGVKVLDFGLAKIERQVADPEHTDTMTAAGTLFGTVQYMSPEQAQGKDSDARSDIFSFGVVFYEMLTGKRAFEGADPASLIAAILEREPPVLEPEGLNRVVKACLAKDPADRFQSARDVKRAVEWNVSGDGKTPIVESAPQPGGPPRAWLGWGVAALLAVGLAAVGFLYVREKPAAPSAPVRFQIPVPENSNGFPDVSPDGRKLAFIVGLRIWVHFLDSGETRNLTATEGRPAWSPDSRFITFPLEKKLRKMEVTGGPIETVSDLPFRWGGATWNRDGVIVYGTAPGPGLFRVSAAGGVPVQITAIDSTRQGRAHHNPHFLPDGRHFVYFRGSADPSKSAIYVGSVDAKPDQQNLKPLVSSHWAPGYAPSTDPDTGYLLFVRDGTLMAQLFDNRKLELIGQPAPLVGQVADSTGGDGGFAAFSASDNGVLVFRPGVTERKLTWYDQDGKVLGTVGEPGDYRTLALSPDGTRLAVSKRIGPAENIWLMDLSSGASTQFTFGSARDQYPIWSPDGSRVIYCSNRGGAYDLYEKPANGGKDAVLVLKSNEQKIHTDWSRDGLLLFASENPTTKGDIWLLPLDRDKKPFPFLATEFDERGAHFSPDGHWVAYTSDESGHPEVYVRSFSMNSSRSAVEPGGKWRVSKEFSNDARWRSDGRELYYRSYPDGRPSAVEISTNPEFRSGKPRTLGFFVPRTIQWSPAADGRRFLVATAKDSAAEPYTVVLNWQAGLKK